MEEKRLKILHLVDTFYPVVGGISTVVDRSCVALSKYADVTVGAVKSKRSFEELERPYKIIRCAGFYNSITKDGIAFPDLDKKFVKEVMEGGYDVIHCHMPINFLKFAKKVGKKLKIPVITTIHTIFKPDVKHFIKSEPLADAITRGLVKSANKADYIWTVSKYAYSHLKQYGLTKPTYIMRNAIEFVAPKNTEELKEKINSLHELKPDTFVMLAVSRMVKNKNIDLIIDAVEMLKNQEKNFKVLLVGGGEYLNSLKRKIKKLELEEYFTATGIVRDRELLSAYYARADLVLFPSAIDASGLIQIEAAAFSKPTLVIEDSAPAENMIDGENGLISKNEPASYAEKMRWAILNSEDLIKIGEQAHKTIYRCYNDENVVKEMLDVYKNTIEDYRLKLEREKERARLKKALSKKAKTRQRKEA